MYDYPKSVTNYFLMLSQLKFQNLFQIIILYFIFKLLIKY